MFAARVALASISNWTSLHGVSNIPSCDRRLLVADSCCMGGEYQKMSLLMFAGRYRTPATLIAERDDSCTPLTQGLTYNRALAEKTVESACAGRAASYQRTTTIVRGC